MSPSGTSQVEDHLTVEELRDTWSLLSQEDRVLAFKMVPHEDAEDFFLALSARDQAELVSGLPAAERRGWMRLLPPDDAADLVQESEHEIRDELLGLLDDATRKEVVALMAYAEDEAGGLMDPALRARAAGHDGGRGDQLSAEAAARIRGHAALSLRARRAAAPARRGGVSQHLHRAARQQSA